MTSPRSANERPQALRTLPLPELRLQGSRTTQGQVVTTYDNGPPLEGWQVEPRTAPVFDLVTRIKRELETLPEHIVLGEN